MGWSYAPSLPTNRDKVRLYIGDTDQSDQLMQDEELDGLLTIYPRPIAAAAFACQTIAAKFSRYASKSVGPLSIQLQQRADAYNKQADLYREMSGGGAAASGPVPKIYVGGISQSDKDTVEEDDDRTEPAFAREMFKTTDIPGGN